MKKFSVLCLILALAMVMTGTARANYLLNPGFEDVDPCDPNEPNEWVFIGFGEFYSISYITGDPTYAHGGDDYVELDVTSYSSTVVYQEHNIAEGIDYKLKAWAKAIAYTMPSPASIKLEFKDWRGGWIRQDILDISAGSTWAQYALDSNGPAPIGTRLLACTVVNETDYSIVYYDDLELTSTPDFASLNDCQQAQFNQGWSYYIGDLTKDCAVDFRDFAEFAESWLKCNAVGCDDYGYGY